MQRYYQYDSFACVVVIPAADVSVGQQPDALEDLAMAYRESGLPAASRQELPIGR